MLYFTNYEHIILGEQINWTTHNDKEKNKNPFQTKHTFEKAFKTQEEKEKDFLRQQSIGRFQCTTIKPEKELSSSLLFNAFNYSKNKSEKVNVSDRIKINKNRNESQKGVLSPGTTYVKANENSHDLQLNEQQEYAESNNIR